MLKFQEFIQEITKRLQEILGEEHKVVVNERVGVNGTIQTYLSIKWRNAGESPRQCMDDCYQVYLSCKLTLEEIVEIAYGLLFEAKEGNDNAEPDYESIKENLRVMLVNYEANRELLEMHPFKLLWDLAALFYVVFETNGRSRTALVEYQHLQSWKIDVETMYQEAVDNMSRLQKITITPMSEALDELGEAEHSADASEMFRVMQMDCGYGAAAVLCEEKLHKFAEEHGRNIYILPCSMHEVLLTLEDDIMDPEDLAELVQWANQTLPKKDFLSNSVYYYDRQQRKISIAVSGKSFINQQLLS